MILAELPALLIVLPLLAAPACIVVARRQVTAPLATVVSWASLAIAVTLLVQVLRDGTIVYLIGDWATPFGIEYRIDTLSAFVAVIVAAIAAVVITFAPHSVAREVPDERTYLFHAMFLLNLTGMLGIAITGDVFNLFVFLEIASLSSYVMISLGRDRRALMAAFKYLVLGTVGATFYVIGVGMMYMMTGSLNMADLAVLLPEVASTRTIVVSVAFVMTGIGLKLAMFPLHFWLPNAYTYAPTAVSAFLAGTATKVAVYAMLRLLFTVFGPAVTDDLPIAGVLLAMGLVAMFAASLAAITQQDAKRLLAYSSLAQIGYMVLGIGFLSATGLTATILHLFNHALMKTALFLVLGCIVLRLGSVKIEDMAGLGRRMPWTMAAFVVGGLSLIGVPLTVGFISKWYLIQASLERGWWLIAAAVLASSLLAMVYIWRIVEVAYFRSRPDGAAEVVEAPVAMLAPVWLLAAANVYFGVTPQQTIGAARDAAQVLLTGGGL